MMNRSLLPTIAAAVLVMTGHAALAQQEEAAHAEEGQHAAEEGAHDEVHLTEPQRRRLALRVGEARAGAAESLITLPASTQFDADRLVKIGPRLPAKVVRVLKDLGETVAAGEPVVVLDSVELGKAKTRYLTTRARLETEQAAYERKRTLAEENISSEADLLEARARYREADAMLASAVEDLRLYGLPREEIEAIEAGAATPLSRYVLTSPIDGVVQERDVTPGQSVSPEETPIHVIDTRQIWVMIEAYERNIDDLETGQRVSLTTRALPERTFEGRIDWISRALEAGTRTLSVRAVIDNLNGLLRAGMFGTAAIQTEASGDGVLVPVGAVQTVEGGDAVFVPGEEPGAFRAVPVVLGAESAGMVEVLSGLRAGEPLVTAGAFDLKSVMTAGTRSAAHAH